MKHLVTFVLFLFRPSITLCQHDLIIEISPLKSNEGQVILTIMDENENIMKTVHEKIENKKCVIVIENLEKRKYAFKYIHDENNNNKLDTKLLILPKEGYGFSNDAKGKFGPPPFEDTLFELKMDHRMLCKPNY